MKTPFWRTYAAVAVLAGLGAYIYFVESKRSDKDEKPKEKVFALDKAKVKELTMTPNEGEAIHLVKEAAGWKLTAPLAVPADGTEADAIVSSLETLEMDEVVAEAGASPAEFGLAPPRLTVGVLVAGAQEPLKLLLGDKVPAGSGLYAKIATGARIFTIPAYLEGSFTKKPFDLRDRSVLHVKRDAVRTLEVTGPEGGFALTRDDKGEWAFTKPLATLAGRWSVDGLLGTLENLRMESVAAEAAKDLKPFGLAKPSRTIVLGLADGTTKALEIGGSPSEKKYHARDASGPLVAVIPGALVDDLAKGMAEFRAKRLLELSTYDVEGFEAQAGGVKSVYARSSIKGKDGIDVHKWKRTTPDLKALDTNTVQEALFKVGGIEVKEFVDSPGSADTYGLTKPTFRLDVRYAPGRRPVWFELGQKDGVTYGRRSDDDAVLKLDAAKTDELMKALKAL